MMSFAVQCFEFHQADDEMLNDFVSYYHQPLVSVAALLLLLSEAIRKLPSSDREISPRIIFLEQNADVSTSRHPRIYCIEKLFTIR